MLLDLLPVYSVLAVCGLSLVSGSPQQEQETLIRPALSGGTTAMSAAADRSEPGHRDPVILSDVMGRDRSINVFAGFIRDIASVNRRIEDRAQNTTILAPINSAISALPQKPWEDAADYSHFGAQAYDGDAGQDRARENMLKFVEAHIVPTSPWQAGAKVATLGGQTIWWEEIDGKRVIQPDGIEVSSVPDAVHNGEVWTLSTARSHA